MGVEYPCVSIVLPVRNEEKYIKICLDSIIAQKYPKKLLEVVVVDGISTDGTRDIILSYKDKYGFIKILDNCEKNTITGLNLGIKNAKGDIIVRVDGHVFLEDNYIEQCVRALFQSDAANVGGLMRPIGKNYIQRAVAFATSTIFGIGWGKFHYSKKDQYVDTVYLGAFKKSLIEKIGLFDPEMSYSEDNEFNLRIARNGGKILLCHKIKSYYFPRESINGLARQYYKYGYYKVKLIKRYKLMVSWRHFIPAIFVGSIVICGMLIPFIPLLSYFFFGSMAAYLGISVIFSIPGSKKIGIEYLPVLPLIFATIHFSYGIGFLKGLKDFILSDNLLRYKAG